MIYFDLHQKSSYKTNLKDFSQLLNKSSEDEKAQNIKKWTIRSLALHYTWLNFFVKEPEKLFAFDKFTM